MLPLNGDIFEPIPDDLLRDHFNDGVLILSGHEISDMLNFIVVSIVLFDRNFNSFFNIVHVSVELRNILNVPNWFWNVERLLLVHDFLHLRDISLILILLEVRLWLALLVTRIVSGVVVRVVLGIVGVWVSWIVCWYSWQKLLWANMRMPLILTILVDLLLREGLIMTAKTRMRKILLRSVALRVYLWLTWVIGLLIRSCVRLP